MLLRVNAKRWFGRYAGEALGSPTDDVAAQVELAGLSVRVLRPSPEPRFEHQRRRRITLVATTDGRVAAIEVR
jgi:hypothetical protein